MLICRAPVMTFSWPTPRGEPQLTELYAKESLWLHDSRRPVPGTANLRQARGTGVPPVGSGDLTGSWPRP